MSAHYVKTFGKAPRWCGNCQEYRGKVGVTSSLKKGASVKITCKMKGGTPVWVSPPNREPHTRDVSYQLTNGNWVAVAHVVNVGKAPVFC